MAMLGTGARNDPFRVQLANAVGRVRPVGDAAPVLRSVRISRGEVA